MNIQRRILTLGLAIAMGAVSAICLSQTVKAENSIYNEKADAHAEIKEALREGERGTQACHPRVWRKLVLRLPCAR
jgi:hypothetical protein